MVMSVAFNYRVTDRGADNYVIHSCFLVTAEKGVPRSFCYAGRGGNKEVSIAERFKEDITLLIRGSIEVTWLLFNNIPLMFHPSTVRLLQYCAAEVMTNDMQFCTVQLHRVSYVCELCVDVIDGRGPPRDQCPRETSAVCTHKINWGEPERAPH